MLLGTLLTTIDEPGFLFVFVTGERKENLRFLLRSYCLLVERVLKTKMLFIWTGDGGPMQYVGLALFLVQLVPYFFFGDSGYILTEQQQRQQSQSYQTQQPPPPQHLQQRASTSTTPQQQQASSTYDYYYYDQTILQNLQSGNMSVFMLLLMGSALFVGIVSGLYVTGYLSNIRRSLLNARIKYQTYLTERTGYEWTTGQTSAFMGLLAGIIISILLTLDVPTFVMVFQWLVFIQVLHRQFRNINGGRDARGNNNSAASQEEKLEKLVETVQRMPIESFVSWEDMVTKTTVKELKQMLNVRRSGGNDGDTTPNNEIDRDSLLESLKKQRQYSETCCICFEDFETNDPMRILPKCCHELHVECMDQWVYTFATPIKQQQNPSCPLCKAPL